MTELLQRDYYPYPTLDRFHCSDAFVRGVMGAWGSGKSSACCMEGLRLSMLQEPAADGWRYTRGLVVRRTYPQLKSTTIKTWQHWIPESICPFRWDSPITAHMRGVTADGLKIDMEVMFMSLDRPRDRDKLTSFEPSWVWVNEAAELNKIFIDDLTGRVGRYPTTEMVPPTRAHPKGGCSRPCLFMDTNPPHDMHWWYKWAEEELPENYEFFRQPGALIKTPDGQYKPNPLAENVRGVPGGYMYWYRMLAGKTSEWIKVHVLGDYGSTFEGMPVYGDVYRDEIHAAKEPLPIYRGLPLYLGWDLGLTPACVFCQAPDGRMNVLREFQAENAPIRGFASQVVIPALGKEFAGMTVISTCGDEGVQRSQVDAATVIGELARLGIPTQQASTNKFLPRREAMMTFFLRSVNGGPGVQIDPSCKLIRRGMLGGYRFDRIQLSGNEPAYHERPIKNMFSHSQDGLQYNALRILEPVRMESSTPPRSLAKVSPKRRWEAAL